VTLPAALVADGFGATLVGHDIYLNKDGTFGGTLSLPAANVNLDGFLVSVQGLTLSTMGVGVMTATATLPGALTGGKIVTVTGTGLMIGTVGSVGGSLTLSGQSLTVAGFGVATTDIILDGAGLSIDHLTLTTPSVFHLAPIAVDGVHIGVDGSISGSVTIPLTLTFGIEGFTFSASTVSLDQTGVRVGLLSLTLPKALGGKTLSGHNIYLTYDGKFGSAPDGSSGQIRAQARGDGSVGPALSLPTCPRPRWTTPASRSRASAPPSTA